MLPGEAAGYARRADGLADPARLAARPARACCDEVSAGRADRSTIHVDDAVLLLCNRAYRLAEEQASRSVEIAHLVVCLTAAPPPDVDFQREGIDRQRLSEAAQAWLCGVARGDEGQAPRTTPEMKALLATAEACASTEGRKFASPSDVIRTLAHRRDDLASARFVGEAMGRRNSVSVHPERGARAQWPDRGEGVGDRRGPRPSQLQFRFEQRYRPQFGAPFRGEGQDQGERGQVTVASREPQDLARGPREHDERGESEAGPSEYRVEQPFDARWAAGSHLAERLRRQEALVADLVGVISRVMDPRGEAGHRDRTGVRRGKLDGGGEDRAGFDEDAASHGGQGRQARSGPDRSQGRSRLFWKRCRTVTIGFGRRSAAAPRGDGGSGRQAAEGLLRVVSRNEPGTSGRRSRAEREPGPEIDELIGSLGDLDADDDGDGLAEGLGDRMKRFYLSPDDDIVKAPSIGPKTAARLTPAGLVLVRDLLACDPEDIVARTANRYITAGRIADWKAQARLVCTIPWLRGTHAQLLVGAGYDTLAKLSRADASSVCSAILRFAATREGQSILRSGPPPEIDRIACWIENTALAEPARAA